MEDRITRILISKVDSTNLSLVIARSDSLEDRPRFERFLKMELDFTWRLILVLDYRYCTIEIRRSLCIPFCTFRGLL